MGLGNYVRSRKKVKADRAESGSHEKLVSALAKAGGWARNGEGTGWGNASHATKMDTDERFERGGGNFNAIPAGSKPATPKNSDSK